MANKNITITNFGNHFPLATPKIAPAKSNGSVIYTS